ncbi:MAG: NPCBM/NEW2 domain-containing protein [Planctomycetaceae bacterium]|jgi:hypothetical protein|nr:NPCBM/NEW2 domain-containing protein [Planctomycetaceae bacterium]
MISMRSMMKTNKCGLVVFCLFLLLPAFSFADETPFEVLNADGDRIVGAVVSVDADKVVLKTKDGQKELPLDRLSFLKNQNVRRAGENAKTVSVLYLRDGSVLVAEKFTMKNTAVSCFPLPGKETAFPLAQLRAARLSVKSEENIAAPPVDWVKFTAAEGKSDRLIAGQPGSLDTYTGILREVSEETVSFSVDGETLPVPRRKVYGLLLTVPNGTETVAGTVSLGLLKLWNGSVAVLRSLKTNESGGVEWTTLSDISGTSQPADIELFDFGRKNASYLSDLKPVRIEQDFVFGTESADSPLKTFLQFRSNKLPAGTDAVKKEPLPIPAALPNGSKQEIPDRPLPDLQGFQLDGTVYEHGLTLPAKTTLEYDLPENFKTLRFAAGIDDRHKPNGQVLLRVQADGQLLLETVLQGTQSVLRQELNIEGKKKLTLSAEYSGVFSEPAILTLGDVKLIK